MKPDIDILTEIGGAKILEFVTLTSANKSTGATRHIIGEQEQKEFYGLAICQYEEEDGFYLFYCDSDWKELNDTWHEDLESAKDQASFEFTGLEVKWKKK
mgnify:CR=1 FL=1